MAADQLEIPAEIKSNILELLTGLEELRLSCLAECNRRKAILLKYGPWVVGIALVVLLVIDKLGDAWGVFPAAAFLAWFWMNAPANKYHVEYKNKIIPQILEVMGNFEYRSNKHSGINLKNTETLVKELLGPYQGIIKSSGIIPKGDDWYIEDVITGNHQGVDTLFSELKITRSSGNNSKVTVFQGGG